MKTTISIIAFAGIASSLSNAALVAKFSWENAGLPGGIPASDWADSTNEPTGFGPVSGSVVRQAGTANFQSWGTSIDLLNYAGFKISAQPGYAVSLTNLAFQTSTQVGLAARLMTSFAWGYRIDGNNDGDFTDAEETWNMGRVYVPTDAGFADFEGAEDVWDFADFTTTGTVEFGLFGSAATTNGRLLTRDTTVNGSVSAVPEPSALVLGGVGALALLRRRRA